jgi:hypothetical protein
MTKKTQKKWWLWIFPGLLAGCLVLAGVSALVNRSF